MLSAEGGPLALLMLVLVAIVFGLGFVTNWLFVASAALFVVWLAGWWFRAREARWFRW